MKIILFDIDIKRFCGIRYGRGGGHCIIIVVKGLKTFFFFFLRSVGENYKSNEKRFSV